MSLEPEGHLPGGLLEGGAHRGLRLFLPRRCRVGACGAEAEAQAPGGPSLGWGWEDLARPWSHSSWVSEVYGISM